jgi:hypothetical protein
VLADVGGWISGPSLSPCDACRQDVHCFDAARCPCCNRGPEPITTEPVAADRIVVGDIVLIDGIRAEITDIRHGDYWLLSGDHGRGVALGWYGASASGVMFRAGSDLLDRITP